MPRPSHPLVCHSHPGHPQPQGGPQSLGPAGHPPLALLLPCPLRCHPPVPSSLRTHHVGSCRPADNQWHRLQWPRSSAHPGGPECSLWCTWTLNMISHKEEGICGCKTKGILCVCVEVQIMSMILNTHACTPIGFFLCPCPLSPCLSLIPDGTTADLLKKPCKASCTSHSQ